MSLEPAGWEPRPIQHVPHEQAENGVYTRRRKTSPATIAALTVLVLSTVAACGPATAHHASAPQATRTPVETASQKAVSAAAKHECAIATKVLTQVNGAQTIMDFNQGEPLWQAELTAANTTGNSVPQGRNLANIVAANLAEAALALVIAEQHANPFGNSFSASGVKHEYGITVTVLQNAVTACDGGSWSVTP
jgi:hypothetical protein